MILSFQTLEFWPCLYMYKHWNYDLIIFSFQTSESWTCLFLYTLELLSYPSKHWNPGPIIYLYYTFEFSPHPFIKHWNSGPVFIIIGILAQLLQTWEFLYDPFTANIEILALSLKTLEFSSYLHKHCNFRLILPDTLILALFLYTLEFWPHPS